MNGLNDRFGPNLGTPTLFKFLKLLVKKLRFFKRGNFDVKLIFLIAKFAAWRRQIFLHVDC
jgi:hypothetical protein